MTFDDHCDELPEAEAEFLRAYVTAPAGAEPMAHACKATGMDSRHAVALVTSLRGREALRQAAAEAQALAQVPGTLSQLRERDDSPTVDSAWVLATLVRLATSTVRDFMHVDEETGAVRFVLDADNAHALDDLQALDMTETVLGNGDVERTLKLKLPDKLKAVQMIGMHHAVRAFEARDADESDEAIVSRIRAGRDRLARKHKGDEDHDGE